MAFTLPTLLTLGRVAAIPALIAGSWAAASLSSLPYLQ
jgi:hypothetical protein